MFWWLSRRDLEFKSGFSLADISLLFRKESAVQRTLTVMLMINTHQRQSCGLSHKYAKTPEKGNGFGFGLVKPDDDKAISRTISARYHKDGKESLVDRVGIANLGEKT
ncbi:hypothetical protein M8494_33665 (plasmid) [Serratia ureilytica]